MPSVMLLTYLDNKLAYDLNFLQLAVARFSTS